MKKISCAVALLAVIFAMLVVLVSADEPDAKLPSFVMSYAQMGYSGSEAEIFAPGAAEPWNFYKFPTDSGLWNCSGISTSQRQFTTEDGITVITANIPDVYRNTASSSDKYVMLTIKLTEAVDLSAYSSLKFGMSMYGVGINEYLTKIMLVTSAGEVTAESYLETSAAGDNWSLIAVDTRELSADLYGIYITVLFSGESVPYSVMLTSPYLERPTDRAFEYADKYSADRPYPIIGSFDPDSGEIVPYGADGAAVVGKLTTLSEITPGGDAFFCIGVSDIVSGTMSLGIRYKDYKSGQYVYTNKISLSGDGIYTIPIDVHGDILTYFIRFDNVQSGDSFTLDFVQLYTSSYTMISADSALGSVREITRAGNSIRFAGEMERAVVSGRMYDVIRFYALPTPFSPIGQAVEIGTANLSTRFEFTANVSGAPVNADTYAYFVGVVGEDGEIIPISSPAYPNSGVPKESSVSNIGLYGAATVGAFESNASHVLVDIPLDKLITDGANLGDIDMICNVYGTGVNGDECETRTITFSKEMTDSIDRDINFYASAGVKVYLRITLSDDDGAAVYDLTSAVSRQVYAAIIKFLASRYSTVDGFVIGSGFKSGSYGGRERSSAAEYAVDIAEICRITHNVIDEYAEGALVVVPVSDDKYEENGRSVSTGALAVMLSSKLGELGRMPWAFMYMMSDKDDSMNALRGTGRLMSELGISTQYEMLYFYEPNPAELEAEYTDYVYGGGNMTFSEYVADMFSSFAGKLSSSRAVFLSIEDLALSNDHDFYSALKKSSETSGFVYESHAEEVWDDSSDGLYAVWDFTDKYHTLDWIAGGGVKSCVTAYSDILSEITGRHTRALRTEYTREEAGIAGITLCNLRDTLDLGSIDKMNFELLICGEESYYVTVVFVIGTNDYRAEYYANTTASDELKHFSCDLSDYPYSSAVDYVGIAVYSDGVVHMELAEVTAAADMTGEEIAAVFANEKQTSEQTHIAVTALVTVVTAALTVVVFVLISRRDKEERAPRTV